jgi:ketosteroid isomerase-like protein
VELPRSGIVVREHKGQATSTNQRLRATPDVLILLTEERAIEVRDYCETQFLK